MGLHAHLLESGRCAPELLPLHNLLGQPRSCHLPLEQIRAGIPVHCVPVRLLDLGYSQQPEEPLPPAGARYPGFPQDFPTAAVADGAEPQDYQVPSGYDLGRWVV